jgi:hypothetical protein
VAPSSGWSITHTTKAWVVDDRAPRWHWSFGGAAATHT